MRNYELVLVVKSSVTEPNRKKLLETVTSMLGKVKITKEEDWGSKALKYKIKKDLTGHFYDLKLETDAVIAADFEKRLQMQEEIVRHLLVRTK